MGRLRFLIGLLNIFVLPLAGSPLLAPAVRADEIPIKFCAFFGDWLTLRNSAGDDMHFNSFLGRDVSADQRAVVFISVHDPGYRGPIMRFDRVHVVFVNGLGQVIFSSEELEPRGFYIYLPRGNPDSGSLTPADGFFLQNLEGNRVSCADGSGVLYRDENSAGNSYFFINFFEQYAENRYFDGNGHVWKKWDHLSDLPINSTIFVGHISARNRVGSTGLERIETRAFAVPNVSDHWEIVDQSVTKRGFSDRGVVTIPAPPDAALFKVWPRAFSPSSVRVYTVGYNDDRSAALPDTIGTISLLNPANNKIRIYFEYHKKITNYGEPYTSSAHQIKVWYLYTDLCRSKGAVPNDDPYAYNEPCDILSRDTWAIFVKTDDQLVDGPAAVTPTQQGSPAARIRALVPIYRAYFNSDNGPDHFWTNDQAEWNQCVNIGYRQEGKPFFLSASPGPDDLGELVPVYRSSNNVGHHIYGNGTGEYPNNEGILGYAYTTQVTGTVPLVRMYNSRNGDRLITVDPGEQALADPSKNLFGVLVPSDWKIEGKLGFVRTHAY